MSNQDQYGSKTQANQYGDDFDSLSDDQKIQRKEQYAQAQGGSGSLSQSGLQSDSSLGQANQYGDDFDSLSDDQKIERKNQYAQNQGQQTSASQGGLGATDQSANQQTSQLDQQQQSSMSANKTGYGSSQS